MKRVRRILGLLLLICLSAYTLLFLQNHGSFDGSLHPTQSEPPEGPLPNVMIAGSHPIHQLIAQAEDEFEHLKAKQSKTLEDAVVEYQRRYGMPPPPNFDQWYKFATKKGVQLIDEYDTIYHALLPFWAIEPHVLRERVRHTIGFDNAMISVMIRNGKVVKTDGGGEMYAWHRQATPTMLKPFVQYLPDMDLAFNIHDEPRIVMQHDDLDRHVKIAKTKKIPSIWQHSVTNDWSPRPQDLGDGLHIEEVKTTRFNKFAHQPTWSSGRMSCPLDSAARSCFNDTCPDDATAYTSLPLGFIQNTTAFTDVCNTPSLETTFGFFDRPNAFDVAHELIPVFSQSKVSSYQDILYPSPWYYTGKVTYHSFRDYYWENKNDTMFWRGSTTGGFSRNGGWRRQHRQLFVQKVQPEDDGEADSSNSESKTRDDTSQSKILELDNSTDPSMPVWRQTAVPRSTMQHYFDIKFTGVGQCDPEDCDEQKSTFDIAEPVNMFDALGSKYLLDIDGNAFSGRYYAWLQSNSLVFKLALFREWHDEWLKPWVHFVPLSLAGDEYVEMMRFFSEDDVGKILARRLARQGQEWANKVLRNADLEVWYFRLLLEYGRLVDDRRYSIGFRP